MPLEISSQQTYQFLLIVQALHLFHHRVTKRHISYAEVTGGIVLCFLPSAALFPDWAYIASHLLMSTIQIIGSIWIEKFSPDWNGRNS